MRFKRSRTKNIYMHARLRSATTKNCRKSAFKKGNTENRGGGKRLLQFLAAFMEIHARWPEYQNEKWNIPFLTQSTRDSHVSNTNKYTSIEQNEMPRFLRALTKLIETFESKDSEDFPNVSWIHSESCRFLGLQIWKL